MVNAGTTSGIMPVTADNFNRAESDLYFGNLVKDGGFGKFTHKRDVTPIDEQMVIRMNRDTLYSGAVFDLNAGPVTIALPDAGERAATVKHYIAKGPTKPYTARKGNASDEGQHNGLYWPVAQGDPASPLGPLADVAKDLGYSHSDQPQPFNGYYYKILTQQRDAAKGGAKDYLQNGKLTSFAVLAWPAKYRDSGIMTFVVGQDGVIHEKDLGDKTAEASTALTAYDPSERSAKNAEELGWQRGVDGEDRPAR